MEELGRQALGPGRQQLGTQYVDKRCMQGGAMQRKKIVEFE